MPASFKSRAVPRQPVAEIGTASETPDLREEFEKFEDRPSKSAQVYEMLRHAIISLRLAPGAVINEKELCAQLDISRTPLREAIQQLIGQNLVDVRPGSGTFITKISLQDALEGQVLRDALEAKLARLAARFAGLEAREELEALMFRHGQRVRRWETEPYNIRNDDELFSLDEQFHGLIAHAAGLPGMARTLRAACSHLDRLRRLSVLIENDAAVTLCDHTAIANAIFARDERAAEQAMSYHIKGMFQTLKTVRTARPDYFSEDPIPGIEGFAGLTD